MLAPLARLINYPSGKSLDEGAPGCRNIVAALRRRRSPAPPRTFTGKRLGLTLTTLKHRI
jgi:hypothetical protein